MVRILKRWRFKEVIGFLLRIRDVTVMRCNLLIVIGGASLPLASYSRSMASSFVDFVSQARGIVFYGSVASLGQHFTCYLEPHNRLYSNCVVWMLLSGH